MHISLNKPQIFLKSFICVFVSIFLLAIVDISFANEHQIDNPLAHTPTNEYYDFLKRMTIEQGKGEFTQKKYFKFLSEPILSKGVFYLDKKNALWETQKPVFSQLFLTKSAVYTRLNSNKKFQPLVENKAFSLLLSGLIRGNFDLSNWQDIKIFENKCASLTPMNASLKKIFFNVKVCLIDGNKRQINIIDTNQNTTEIYMDIVNINLDNNDHQLLNPELPPLAL